MLVIELRFPAGQYHATPWGRHVNEGEVEWPPSPWRLVRALLATWHLKASSEISEAVLRRLVDKLCDEPPAYRLPHADSGHTRHYMPLYNTPRDERTARVFDVFLRLGPEDKAHVVWSEVSLDPEERSALELLLSKLSYLGRAESWVEAGLGDSDVVPTCRPVGEEGVSPNSDVVRLLVPESSQSFLQWRAAVGSGNGKQGKGRKAAGPHIPTDLLEALQADTGDLRRDGWSQPPGSRFIEYVRPRTSRQRTRLLSQRPTLATVARFAVTSPVPPLLTESLSFAERIHQALVSKSDARTVVLRGKSDDHTPLAGHQHVHIFCEAQGRDKRRVTHVTLWAPMGFDREAETALGQLRRVFSRSDHMAQLVLLGVGTEADNGSPLFAWSRVWKSLTPFVPTRHPKPRKLDGAGRVVGSPEHDLVRLLTATGRPEPVSVTPLPWINLGGHRTSWLEFRTQRHHGGGIRAANRGWGFQIEFAEEVQGPISVGYGSHFGLGLFVPDR